MTITISESNSLADLAARILAEHTAIHGLLSESVQRAMAAGDLLIEAKALVNHGEWMRWLEEHCKISDRTARLYMRVAKNRAEIEATKMASVADLTLSEATALLMLSSDVRKLMAFMRQIENLDGEELVQACIEANIGIIHSPNYNPFHGRSDEECREWFLFMLWMVRQGASAKWAGNHVEWLLQRPFKNVAEWLSEGGDLFRARWWMSPFSGAGKLDWSSFAAERGLLTQPEIEAEIIAFDGKRTADGAASTTAGKQRRHKRRA